MRQFVCCCYFITELSPIQFHSDFPDCEKNMCQSPLLLSYMLLAVACGLTQALHADTTLTAAAKSFGTNGKLKMLYDVRSRPQSVLLYGRVYIVYNGDAKPSKNGSGDARPMLITYDPRTRSFSKSTKLGSRSTDHHYSPIIWADEDDHLHVLFGCHKTSGTHLVSAQPVDSKTENVEWKNANQMRRRFLIQRYFASVATAS